MPMHGRPRYPRHMFRPTCVMLALLGLSTALPVARGAEAPTEDRVTVNMGFRRAFFAGEYDAALPLATQVVELTRTQFGNDAPQLVNPLTNLGTTHYRMGRFEPALDAYREALRLLDLQGEAANEKLVRPLHGMGAALRGLKRDTDAIVPFKRAIEIVRNRQGLHSVSQLPLLKELVACYMSTGRISDAGREQLYAFGVAEAAYGKDDARMIGPLEDYALWHEGAGRFTAARVLHARAVQIADEKLGASNLQAIPPLRGIARSYRQAFIFGEAEESMQAVTSLQEQIAPNLISRAATAPSSEGERALRNALDRLAAAPLPQPPLRAAVLIDLGDWYLTASVKSRAMATYVEAWNTLGAEAAAPLLGHPEVVVYRPPAIAVSRRQFSGEEDYAEQEVRLRLSITAEGEVREAIVANASPPREAAEKAVLAAVKRAQWRPAFRDGAPVATTDVEFVEPVYIRRPKEK
jgi:TonB family protein